MAYLSERKVCACVKWVNVTSRLSCRVFIPHFGSPEHSVFGQIRLSDNFGLRLNFGLGHVLFLIFYLDQCRNFYYFLIKTCFHHNICHHHIRKNVLKYPSWLSEERHTCKTDRRLQLRAKMNCQDVRTYTWAGEQLAWNNVDSHGPVRVDWAGGLFVRAQSLRLRQMSKCHFTIIMSCVQSTLRIFGTFGIRSNSAFG